MPKPFRFGIVSGGATSRGAWLDLARKAEGLGYATLLMPDRTGLPLAPLAALAAVAAATSTLRVGSYVFCNDFRHPALLAREAATLSLLSDGRFELGIGAGAGPGDYRQLGLPFDPPGVRVGRVAEALEIITRMFAEPAVSFAGQHYTLAELPGLPGYPRPPIFVGSAGQRLLKLAARYADSIAPTPRYGAPAGGPPDATLDEKVGWVRAAAGSRFDQIELAQVAYAITITDSPDPAAPPPGGPPIPRRPMSAAQAAEHLLGERERYGFSYIQVHAGQADNFASVVAQLAGR
jgi:probable F420-dependent oxidoreductase